MSSLYMIIGPNFNGPRRPASKMKTFFEKLGFREKSSPFSCKKPLSLRPAPLGLNQLLLSRSEYAANDKVEYRVFILNREKFDRF